MTTVPLAAAAIVAIFGIGMIYIAWRAWHLRAEERDELDEPPTETIQERARKWL